MSMSKFSGDASMGIPDLRFCPSCKGQFYLRKGLCVNLLCKDYYLSQAPNMRLYQRGRRENNAWDPDSWRSNYMYDKVYQAHLALEARLAEEDEEENEEEPGAREPMGSAPGPSIVEVDGSSEEEICHLEEYESSCVAEGKDVDIPGESMRYRAMRA